MRPPKEPIVSIKPRFCFTIFGATSAVMRSVPKQFTVTISSISSSSVSIKETGISWLLPTLLTKIAISRELIFMAKDVKKFSPRWAKSRAQVSILMFGFWDSISAARAESLEAVREMRRRLKGVRARCRANSLPRPSEAPVTMAQLVGGPKVRSCTLIRMYETMKKINIRMENHLQICLVG